MKALPDEVLFWLDYGIDDSNLLHLWEQYVVICTLRYFLPNPMNETEPAVLEGRNVASSQSVDIVILAV